MRDPVAFEKLAAIAPTLRGASDRAEVLRLITHTARALNRSDGATFVFGEQDKVFYAEENSDTPLWKGMRFPASACISGWVIQNAKPAVITNIYCDSRVPIDAYRSTYVKSIAMVPVISQVPVAAIGTYWAEYHRTTDAELELLLELARFVGEIVFTSHLAQPAE